MKYSTKQMREHGVNCDRHPVASFVFGRGWKGHASADIARRAVARDVARAIRLHGGGAPSSCIASTSTGKAV